ncbi:MAG: DnaD domain protein [Oscillospiraceae bacterium]|nr:DnaD domain protein [Oscillospiraceae bacterium]
MTIYQIDKLAKMIENGATDAEILSFCKDINAFVSEAMHCLTEHKGQVKHKPLSPEEQEVMLFGRVLTIEERGSISYMRDTIHLPTNVIGALMTHAAKEGYGAKKIERLALDLKAMGVTTSERADEIIFLAEVCDKLGAKAGRNKALMQYVKSWQAAGHTSEMVELAYKLMLSKIDNVSLPYMTKILEIWAAEGIFTATHLKLAHPYAYRSITGGIRSIICTAPSGIIWHILYMTKMISTSSGAISLP